MSRKTLASRTSFIKSRFTKRECRQFMSTDNDPERCGCGKLLDKHDSTSVCGQSEQMPSTWTSVNLEVSDDVWNPSKHTIMSPTDAFGTIEFQGGSNPIKAQYVRLSYETSPEKVLNLLLHEWKLELPKLVMSIHGGKANFQLQPKLKKIIQDGLLKAAKTTGAWIFTGGTNSGVIKHVGEAFNNERSQTLRGRVVTIGIAPWGIIENRKDLIGENVTVPYQNICSLKSKFAMLNNRHAYFLLVDDGTVGKFGCEIGFRKRLEKHISKQTISSSQPSRPYSSVYLNGSNSGLRTPTPEHKPYGIPIVGVIIEGGADTIRCVLEYVTDTPPIPVVVCDGSGRAADLLAFTHKYINDGTLPAHLVENVLNKIELTFHCNQTQSKSLLEELILCVKRKELITIFRMGEEPVLELDQAILICLLKGSRLSAPDQLSLALTWNRVDIARCEVFVYGQEWTNEMLEQAMMDALTWDSVDFVQLLLENGVNMGRFLTINRLEDLYNTKRGPTNTLGYLLMDVTKRWTSHRVTLLEIGLVIEKLMGGAYQSRYRSREFRARYEAIKRAEGSTHCETPLSDATIKKPDDFACPYNELLLWAVLMKRQQMALFMFQREEEALAKALVAMKLYKSMAHEAAQDDLETEISENFKSYSQEFEKLALELLDYCYRQNDFIAMQMLTYELNTWGNQTCLTLAVAANHVQLLAHPCCQILLADLWLGGIRTRKSTNLKVLLGLLFPPFILTLEFKSKEELKLMPQTEQEHNSMGKHEDDGGEDIPEEVEVDANANDVETGGSRRCIMEGEDSRASKRSVKTHIRKSSLRNHDKTKGKKFKHERPLRLGKKLYEFYTAPLTKFFGYSITYFFFLCVMSYDVLTIMSPTPDWPEIYCLIYIITFTIEIGREIAMAEPVRLSQKILMWLDNKWNPCDIVAILIYISAFVARLIPSGMDVSKVIYATNSMYWYLRILHLLSVNKYFGPFVTMIGKMVINMVYFVVFLLVVLGAFGVCRQAILNPYESPNWTIAREIFFHPYFMLYGEVYADYISPPCGDSPDLSPCRTGRWVTVVAMCLFLLIANILLINLLIAVFNNIYINVDAVAQQVWKSKRYTVIMEYEQKPVFPPPFIIINHLYMLYQYIRSHCSKDTQRNSHVLKLFLSDCELEAVHDFEEECVDGYIRERKSIIGSSSIELVKSNNSRIESLNQKVEDLFQRSSTHSSVIQELKFGVREMTDELSKVSGYLAVIHRYMTSQGHFGDQQVDYKDLVPTASLTLPSRFTEQKHDCFDEEYIQNSKTDLFDDEMIDTPNEMHPTTSKYGQYEGHENFNEPVPHAINESLLISATDFYRKMQYKQRRHQSNTNFLNISVTSPADDNGNDGSWLRRRHINSERCSVKSSGEPKPSTSLIAPAFNADSAINNLLHDYTSITDEIESQQLFRGHSFMAAKTKRRKCKANEVLSECGCNLKHCTRHELRRHSTSDVWKADHASLEQAIMAKEKQLLEAEQQDYLRLEKIVENRLRKSFTGTERKETASSDEEIKVVIEPNNQRRTLSLDAEPSSFITNNSDNFHSNPVLKPIDLAEKDLASDDDLQIVHECTDDSVASSSCNIDKEIS
ncbi:hypothetical protein CHUAL_005324 [Chamberlinius hualienensis]